MLKKDITYVDFNGVERTEPFYFNLTKAELVEMEMGISGGLTALIKRVSETNNTPELIRIFKSLILKSYGEKSLDGKNFMKNNTIREQFESTEAYSVLFMELATDAEAAANFVNGLVPAEPIKLQDHLPAE